jgi:predicted RND superfamily exporter protein
MSREAKIVYAVAAAVLCVLGISMYMARSDETIMSMLVFAMILTLAAARGFSQVWTEYKKESCQCTPLKRSKDQSEHF